MTLNLHIVRNGVSNDSRVLKETATLRDAGLFEFVEIAGFEQAGLPEKEDIGGRNLWRVNIRSRGLPNDLISQTAKFFEWSRRIILAYRNKPLSVIHCNDLVPLPIGARLKQLTGAKIVYDAHELETERAGVNGVRKRLIQLTESRYMKYVDATITVSPSIQAWYESHYPNVPVYLVRNVPECPTHKIEPVDLRGSLGVPDSSLLFIYLGGHAQGRGIEKLLQAFSSHDVQHHVVFVGDGALAELVRSYSNQFPNIHWMAPVPPDSVLSVSAGADVGLSLIEDIALSYRFALPNKLFECWLAGIPVVVSAIPDQVDLVTKYKAGWVAPSSIPELASFLRTFTASDLDSVSPGVENLRKNISWENESTELLAAYNFVLDR